MSYLAFLQYKILILCLIPYVRLSHTASLGGGRYKVRKAVQAPSRDTASFAAGVQAAGEASDVRAPKQLGSAQVGRRTGA